MSGKGWHILRDGGQVTLARQLPARFDIAARTVLPEGSASRYAHQIRQDMWRALQNLRGFSPVVQLQSQASGWEVTAGGRVARSTPNTVSRLQTLLDDPDVRRRWIAFAQRSRA